MKNKKECYSLTLKGLIGDEIVMDKIYAHLYRTQTNAIVFEDCPAGGFVKVHQEKKP